MITGGVDPLASPYFITRPHKITSLISVAFSVTTDANIANREYSVIAQRVSEGRLIAIWSLLQQQAASQTKIKLFLRGLPFEQNSGSYQQASLSDNLLPAETGVRVVTTSGGQAGDRIGDLTIVFEEWDEV